MRVKQYDPNLCPPDYKIVFDHLRASSIGIPVIDNDDEQADFCVCCNQPINKVKLKLNVPTRHLS